MSCENVINRAIAEINYREDPPNSNFTKYGELYGVVGVPWCVIFLWWCFQEANESKAFFGGKKTASCGQLYSWHKQSGQTVPRSEVKRGDIVILNFHGTTNTEHCGIVENVAGDKVVTIEGNTTISNQSEDNGGIVARKTRHFAQIVGVIRPRYLPPDIPENAWFADSVRYAIESGYMQGYTDGTFKPYQNINRAELAAILERLAKDAK